MTNLREVYQCAVCGNVIEVVNNAAGELVCCNQPMNKLEPKTEDQGKEKHVPVVEGKDCGVKVKVGDTAHPMEDAHYIKFIEILTDNKVIRAELKPGDDPAACFSILKGEIKEVREFCTVHGLWKS